MECSRSHWYCDKNKCFSNLVLAQVTGEEKCSFIIHRNCRVICLQCEREGFDVEFDMHTHLSHVQADVWRNFLEARNEAAVLEHAKEFQEKEHRMNATLQSLRLQLESSKSLGPAQSNHVIFIEDSVIIPRCPCYRTQTQPCNAKIPGFPEGCPHIAV